MNRCALCSVDLGDDAHWHSDLEVDVCIDHCPEPDCFLPPAVVSVTDDTGRVPVPGERDVLHSVSLHPAGALRPRSGVRIHMDGQGKPAGAVTRKSEAPSTAMPGASTPRIPIQPERYDRNV